MFIGFILCLSKNSIVWDIFIATAMIWGAFKIIEHFLIYKMLFYTKKHPDKAKEFERYWLIDYKGTKLLDKECDIADPVFSRLRKNWKRAKLLSQLAFLLMLLLAFVVCLFAR
jgi:hypothetical protein